MVTYHETSTSSTLSSLQPTISTQKAIFQLFNDKGLSFAEFAFSKETVVLSFSTLEQLHQLCSRVVAYGTRIEGGNNVFSIDKIFLTSDGFDMLLPGVKIESLPVFSHPLIPPSITLPNPSIAIVVACYCENIDWIPLEWKNMLYLYEKGFATESSPLVPHSKIINLPNVGRESHTYLTHIINNYEHLDDIIYFTQANPFDHAPHFITSVNCNIALCKPFMMLGNIVLRIRDHNVSAYEQNFPGIQAGFDRTFTTLFCENRHDPLIRFTAGAIFAVHKPIILRRDKVFYERARELLKHSVNPIEGYAFERLWALIFEDR